MSTSLKVVSKAAVVAAGLDGLGVADDEGGLGTELRDAAVVAAYVGSLLPVATVVTPNAEAPLSATAERRAVVGAAGASGAPGGEKDEACIQTGLDKVKDQLK